MVSRVKSPFFYVSCILLLVMAVPIWAQDPSGRPTKPEKPGKVKPERPKPPRTPVTVTPPTVLLTVMAEPESDIYINGDKRGTTNGEGKATFDKMPLAQYTVEVRKA